MPTTVGPKGQVVIEKEIRERLGIEPGAMAVQRVVDDHVEIRFVPPSHRRSLKGILRPCLRRSVPTEDWEQARDAAWESAVREAEEDE